MGADRIIVVGDAVVSRLNSQIAVLDEAGHVIVEPLFQAKRCYSRQFTNEELATLRVDVRTAVVVTEEESRGGTEDSYGVEIGIQQEVDPKDLDAIDTLVTLARRVARLFPVTSILSVPDDDPALGQIQVRENIHAVFDPDALTAGRFFSVISLAFAEFADMP